MSSFSDRHDRELRDRSESDVHGPTRYQKERLDQSRHNQLLDALSRSGRRNSRNRVQYVSTDSVSENVTNVFGILIPLTLMFWFQLFQAIHGRPVNSILMYVGGFLVFVSIWGLIRIKRISWWILAIFGVAGFYITYLIDTGLI